MMGLLGMMLFANIVLLVAIYLKIDRVEDYILAGAQADELREDLAAETDDI